MDELDRKINKIKKRKDKIFLPDINSRKLFPDIYNKKLTIVDFERHFSPRVERLAPIKDFIAKKGSIDSRNKGNAMRIKTQIGNSALNSLDNPLSIRP
jgi:hypothetical protein